MAQTVTKKQLKTGGDDLDDGLELDQELLASSDDEGASEIGDATLDDGLDGEDPLVEDDEADDDEAVDQTTPETLEPGASGSRKRKVEADQGDDDSEEARKADKKRRKKEKEKERKARRQQDKSVAAAANPPSHLAPEELSALLLRSMRESFPSASAVELDDLVIPIDHLLSPPDYPIPSSDSSSLEPLQQRVDHLLKSLQSKKLSVGAPQVIILSLSGLRCADVVRAVRDVEGKGEVAKLFAKHFKLADQMKYLERTKVSVAVGTPARVGKLLSEGAIKITPDTVLLLDVQHQDSKTRTILTLPEVRDELWKTVFSRDARRTLLDGGAKIGAF